MLKSLIKPSLSLPGRRSLKKVDQTYFSDHNGRGNCLQAAVASLFSLSLEEVADLRPYAGQAGPSQNLRLRTWLAQRGWSMIRIDGPQSYMGYYLATGLVTRSIFIKHAVVMKDGCLYHDPHPSRAGLCYQRQVILFYPL